MFIDNIYQIMSDLHLWLKSQRINTYEILVALLLLVLFSGVIAQREQEKNANVNCITADEQIVFIPYTSLSKWIVLDNGTYIAERTHREEFTQCTWIITGKLSEVTRYDEYIYCYNCTITERDRKEYVWK